MLALEQLTARTSALPGKFCRLDADADLGGLDERMANELYRIAQEAVSNAVKHADCHHIEIGLATVDNVLSLTVKDDGIGLQQDPRSHAGMGLQIMRYRASRIHGSLEFRQVEKFGTTVVCTCVIGQRIDKNDE